MSLISLKNLYHSVGEFPLFDHVDFDIHMGERIALIGRNGQGKSTLFKILSQTLKPDQGAVEKPANLRVGRLEQELPPLESMTVYETVAHGLKDIEDLLVQYHHLTMHDFNAEPEKLSQLNELQQQIEHRDGWEIQQKIERMIEALDLPADMPMSALSGGWRRRVALAQTLIQEPDVLLLDEPTNHLDLAAIQWLEHLLLNYPKTIVFITHDRALLRKVATRIVELDRGKVTSYPSDYDVYLARKEQFLLEEERNNALFDKKLSDEEKWLRQGVKARRTRNEGRVRALKALREERGGRRDLQDKPLFETQDVGKTGKTVVQAQGIAFAYGAGKPLFHDFSFTIQRGDKIAIVGPNGVGKTTLIEVLLGLKAPTQGKVKQSPTNQIAFFDQTREHLNLEASLIDNVTEGDDFIEINGKRRHVIGYLGDFLFEPRKCQTLAKTLSGGEQNRLMLAKLFSKPANVLVLDEPTNDLDMESLEVLEDLLAQYPGTVIVISHDREFIDNLATHCIVFEPEGTLSVQVGGYSDWQKAKRVPSKKEEPSKPQPKRAAPAVQPLVKLSYKEQQELKELPGKIEKMEAKIAEFQALMCAPEFYSKPKDDIKKISDQLSGHQKTLADHYARWEVLDSSAHKSS